MAADGSIVISTEIDDKQAQKDLDRLNRKIQTLNDQIYVKQQQKMPLVEQAKKLGAELDSAKAKLYEMQTGDRFYTSSHIKEQESAVVQLQKEWDAVNTRIERMDSGIQKANIQLDLTKDRAGEIQKNLAAASPASEAMSKAMDRMQKSANKFSLRLREVVRSALVFTVISQGLASLREWMGKVIKTNDEATTAIARLKGALLTLAQPLVNVIIPAFTTLVNILTRVISLIAQALSSLFGMTIDQSAEAAESLHNETEALEGVGNAAKSAGKSMANFDEINQLTSSGAGGAPGGAASSVIQPDFSFLDSVNDQLDRIAKSVLLIGAGFALWKIGSALPGMLGAILTKIGGIAVAVGGLIILWDGLADAWENGVNWGNLAEIIAGAAAAVLGLYLAFGKTGAGIGLVISGIAMFITGIQDIMKNGTNLQNLLLTIAGILSAGIGIGIMTGSWIPLLIGGIASILLAITHFAGESDMLIQGLKDIFSGLIDFVTGVFTGDWTRAWNGIVKIFKGIWNTILSIVGSVVNFIIDGINWLISKLNTIQISIPDWVPEIGGKSYGINISPVEKWEIPYLAQGAVIPPNREFLAVLGDQKQGTNIETPLSTMVQAFKTALSDMGYGGEQTVILQVDRDQLGKVVYRLNKAETRRIGVNLTGV